MDLSYDNNKIIAQ